MNNIVELKTIAFKTFTAVAVMLDGTRSISVRARSKREAAQAVLAEVGPALVAVVNVEARSGGTG